MRGTRGSLRRARGACALLFACVVPLAGCGSDGDRSPAASTASERPAAAPEAPPEAVPLRDGVTVHAGAGGAWVLDYEGRLTSVSADGTVGEPLSSTGDRRGRDLDVLASDGRTLWVSEEGVGLRRLDAATGRPRGRPLRAGRQPAALELAGGSLYVGDAFDGSVRRVDPAERRVERRVDVGERIQSIAVAGDVVWAVDQGGDAVHRLRADTLEPAGEPLEAEGTRPFHVSVAAGVVWVSDDDGVTAYEPRTGRRIGRHAPGVSSRPFVAGDEREAWVVGETTGQVHRLDPRTARPAGKPLPVSGSMLAVASDAVWVLGVEGLTRIAR